MLLGGTNDNQLRNFIVQQMTKFANHSGSSVNHTECLSLFQDPEKPGDKPRMQKYEVDLNE